MEPNNITQFLAVAVNSLNNHLSHHQFKPLVELASQNVEIANIYFASAAKIPHPAIILLSQSGHSSCMASYITALCGHPTATASVSRTGLEAALYAYGISHNQDYLEKWRNPPKNRRDRINASICLRLLNDNHPGEFEEVSSLYKDQINIGAHPTIDSLFRGSNASSHRHPDNHIYNEPPSFETEVIMLPGNRSFVQLVTAIATHSTALHIIALADFNHPKSEEIIARSMSVRNKLTDYLSEKA